MNTKPTNEFDNFIDTFVDELIATPDDQILEGLDPAAVQAKGLGLLQAAKTNASRSRLAAAKAGYAALKSKPAMAPQNVSAEEARRFLAQAANDSRFTLAARNLGELSDDEAIALYTKLKSIESSRDGDDK
ncbi:hypothetical protein [Variovorax sp. OV700]|uniref:hypothetical protein n=1 Tax=Variovorax sp. OV700 TaxID=1882826 RepID=UPI00088F01BE|nr:hypothetical protein [Variovorax sp. OV700]SDI59567.1 hypothetical protein SAMN05444748_10624 [Variovorax sp. OV700]